MSRWIKPDACASPSASQVCRNRKIARSGGIPVTVDVDTIYPGFERVLPNTDYLIASEEFPRNWTNEPDPFRALELIQNEYGMRVAGMTLGTALNALAARKSGHESDAVVADLRDQIVQGSSLSNALAKHPASFPPLFVNMIRAGEASGTVTKADANGVRTVNTYPTF